MTIKELREMSAINVSDFMRRHDSVEGVNIMYARGIIAELTNKRYTYPICLPLPSIVFAYFIYKVENNFISDWEIVDDITNPIEDEFTIIAYKLLNEDEPKFLFLTKEQFAEFSSKMTLIDSGFDIQDKADLNKLEKAIDLLDPPIKKYVKWFLNHLELREEDADTPKEFAFTTGTTEENPQILDLTSQSARFSSALWADKVKEKVVTLAGVGGIGRIW